MIRDQIFHSYHVFLTSLASDALAFASLQKITAISFFFPVSNHLMIWSYLEKNKKHKEVILIIQIFENLSNSYLVQREKRKKLVYILLPHLSSAGKLQISPAVSYNKVSIVWFGWKLTYHAKTRTFFSQDGMLSDK